MGQVNSTRRKWALASNTATQACERFQRTTSSRRKGGAAESKKKGDAASSSFSVKKWCGGYHTARLFSLRDEKRIIRSAVGTGSLLASCKAAPHCATITHITPHIGASPPYARAIARTHLAHARSRSRTHTPHQHMHRRTHQTHIEAFSAAS